MPRAKPCLKTSISVTADVQSNASVCFHPHCGSVVWDVFFRECRWPISRAKWPTEWKNPQSMLKIHGVLPQQRASFSQSCGKRDVLGHGGLNPRRVILP